jgi:peptide/nickel transport system substrate-binding protein
MLGMLAMPYCSVIPKEAVSFYGNQFGIIRLEPVRELKEMLWKEGVVLALERNDQYLKKMKRGRRFPI